MNFHGLQKMTLLDFPSKVSCTLFTGGCNFRCPFCHNALLVTELSKSDATPEEEILSFLKKRQGLLDGVCITGGEPLLYKELPEFLKKVRELGFAVKVDTNGSFPQRLEDIINQGLCDYVAVDIKNSREKYGKTVGLSDFDISPVEKTVELLKRNLVPYEFRTTVVREFHQKADFEEMGRWIEGADQYFLQQFMDSGHVIAPGLHAYDEKILFQALEIVKKYVKTAQIRGL